MTDSGMELDLSIPVFVDNDLEVDDHGICSIVSLLYVGDSDDCHESRVELGSVIENIIEFYRDTVDYNQLYLIAHEMTRFAEELRNSAGYMEDSDVSMTDLFNLPDE